MRSPSEFIAAAVKRVQSSLMPDCALSMTLGSATSTVTRAASSTRGDPEISGDSPAENLRVLALVSDFPTIRKGDFVSIEAAQSSVAAATPWAAGSHRLVTSVRADTALASQYIGLSCPFTRSPATVSGKRRSASAVRSFNFPVDILFVENGTADNFTNAAAPTYAYGFTVAIARADWPDATDPEVADTIFFAPRDIPTTVKVSSVTRHDGWFILACRTRE